MELVLEPGAAAPWIGWESAHLEHRRWRKRHTPAQVAETLTKRIDREAIPNEMGYYPQIMALHLGAVGLAVAGSAYLTATTPNGPHISWLVITVLAALVFVAACFDSFHPRKMRDLIENERAVWLAVLGQPGVPEVNS